jgi:hypothetical protein
MDIDALTKGVGLFGSAFATLKQAIDLLPKGPNKAKAAEALERAELEFKKAEAEAAKQLGYEICTTHWPPEVMVTLPENNSEWRCPKCSATKFTGTFSKTASMESNVGKSRWNRP